MKKIYLLLFDNFVNDSRVLKEAKSLQLNGYAVKVIAVHEPLLKKNELIDGVEVVRIVLDKKLKKGYSANLLHIDFTYKVFKEFADADIYHCNDLNTLPCAVFIKKFKNKKIKIVYDAHEYETQRAIFSKTQIFLSRILEKLFIYSADAVFCVNESIANIYEQTYKIKKPFLILNTPNYKKIKQKNNIFRKKFNIRDDQKIFIFQGRLKKSKGIENILETFKDRPDDVIIFIGFGILTGHILKYSNKYNNIFLHEAVDVNKIVEYTNSADYGISSIESSSCLSYYYSLPNKLFEYLMAELPVIVADTPERKSIIENHNVGVIYKYNTPESLHKAIDDIKNLNYNKTVIYIKKIKQLYSWEEQEKKMLNVYKNL